MESFTPKYMVSDFIGAHKVPALFLDHKLALYRQILHSSSAQSRERSSTPASLATLSRILEFWVLCVSPSSSPLGSKVAPFLKGPFLVFILVFIPHADGCVVLHAGILVVIDGHQRYAYACALSVTALQGKDVFSKSASSQDAQLAAGAA